MLSVARLGIDYVQPNNIDDFKAVVSGRVFPSKDTIVLDSISAMTRTFVKDYALTFPRQRGDSPKRKSGVPELDDYGTIGEVTRSLLSQLLSLDKNIIVTAIEKTEKDENGVVTGIGPDLPGQLFLGAPAMFDSVLYFKTRNKLRIPGNAASAYTEYYIITENDGFHVGKDRNNAGPGKSILQRQEIFDLASGKGSFSDLHAKILAAYNPIVAPAASNVSNPALTSV